MAINHRPFVRQVHGEDRERPDVPTREQYLAARVSRCGSSSCYHCQSRVLSIREKNAGFWRRRKIRKIAATVRSSEQKDQSALPSLSFTVWLLCRTFCHRGWSVTCSPPACITSTTVLYDGGSLIGFENGIEKGKWKEGRQRQANTKLGSSTSALAANVNRIFFPRKTKTTYHKIGWTFSPTFPLK